MASMPVDRDPNLDRPQIRRLMDTHRRVTLTETGGSNSRGITIPSDILNGTNLVLGDDILTELFDDGVTYAVYLERWE